jgi:transketolase
MDKSDTRVYVLLGDGEMAEGQIWEAAEFAGHYKLDNLTVIADVNALGQSEPTMYQHDMETYRKNLSPRFCDRRLTATMFPQFAALDRAKATKGRPQAILARTIKGHGFAEVAGKWAGTANRSRKNNSLAPSPNKVAPRP